MSEVKRWIGQWPLHMQPIPGCSGADWTKVEVIPAADYDAAQERIRVLEAAGNQVLRACKQSYAWSDEEANALADLRAALSPETPEVKP